MIRLQYCLIVACVSPIALLSYRVIHLIALRNCFLYCMLLVISSLLPVSCVSPYPKKLTFFSCKLQFCFEVWSSVVLCTVMHLLFVSWSKQFFLTDLVIVCRMKSSIQDRYVVDQILWVHDKGKSILRTRDVKMSNMLSFSQFVTWLLPSEGVSWHHTECSPEYLTVRNYCEIPIS